MTYKQIIYMCLDQVKLASDDSYFTEDHVLFLVSKIRGLILKLKYSDIKKEIPESNYQTICLDIEPSYSISGESCEGVIYLKSNLKIPTAMTIGNASVYPIDYYVGNIAYISRERMKYVGYNKYLLNIIYASLGSDNHLYLKSSNPLFLHLEKVKMTAIFENPEEAAELQCDEDTRSCDIMDKDFPLEDSLVTTLIELAVKFLLGAAYRPSDKTNDASDDLSALATFIRQNMKSNFLKKIDGDD